MGERPGYQQPIVDPDTVCVGLSARALVLEREEAGIRLGLRHPLRYRPETSDHWQHPDEFAWNGYTGDCEDHSFFVQSVLLAAGVPCVSVWKGSHVWNEAHIDGEYWERYDGEVLVPRSHEAVLMTARIRVFPEIWRKEWRWIRHEAEWKDRF